MPASPLVSVVVPTKNNASVLGNCLASINAQKDARIELIVVDNNSSDGTPDVAREHTEHVYNAGPERSAQRNYGAGKAQGDFLLFIDSDMALSPAVVSDCLHIAQAGALAVVVPEESVGSGFWTRCKTLERSFYLGVPWMEAARFFRTDAFAELGGYDEGLTGPEDFDLPQRLERLHGRQVIARAGAFIYHDEQTLSLSTTLRKKFYYARTIDAYRATSSNEASFRKQASPLQRYRLFFSRPGLLFRNPVVGLGMLTMKTLEFAAGASGYLLRRRSKR